VSRIAAVFSHLRRLGQAALMPYLTMGYPERGSALELVPAIVEAGADLIELGVPFSDPLADGATIQAASQQALANGMSLSLCLEQAGLLRAQGIKVPLVLMGYFNPILQMGEEPFAQQAALVGLDGVIVPDLPPEEADGLRSRLSSRGIDLILLLAPTRDTRRVELVARYTRGFLYLVSLTGVTGERERLPHNLGSFVARVRAATDLPLAVGFGISTPEQVAQVARIADGVIVGSALIKAIATGKEPVEASKAFVTALRSSLDAT
jgi:tryptophan synthase alpha chain